MSITLIITAITGIVSFLGFSNPQLVSKLKHFPVREWRNGEWYRLFTCSLVHGGWMHLLVNMFVLWQFGGQIERILDYYYPATGKFAYLAIYVATVILANIPTALKYKHEPYYSAIGASGGVSGIVFMFILFFPWEMLYIYGILPIPGIVAALLYLGYSIWASKNSRDNIDHLAHLYGAVVGPLLLILYMPEALRIFLKALL